MTATRRAALTLSLSGLILLAGCSIDGAGTGELGLGEDDAPLEPPADDDEQAVEDEQRPDDAGGEDSGNAPDTGKDASEDDVGDDEPEARCQPGTYQGTFECTPAAAVGTPWQNSGTTKVTGTVQFVLATTDDDDTLELRMGQFTSTSPLVMIAAKPEGELDCGKPFAGQLRDARYTSLFVFNVPFESPLVATFDPVGSKFTDGTWQVDDANGTQCAGTWTAARSGP